MDLTEEQKRTAIDLATQGKTLEEIRKALGTTNMAFWEYRVRNILFSEEFNRARQEGLEELADSLLTAHEDIPDVYKARLKSENFRWLLSKRKPLVYGDKLDVNINTTVDISGALLEAKQRVLHKRDIADTIDAELVEPKQVTAIDATGCKPDIDQSTPPQDGDAAILSSDNNSN